MASRVEVHGDIHFIGNDGDSIDGGALYVTSLGQLVLFRGANITFQNNTGVYVDHQLILRTQLTELLIIDIQLYYRIVRTHTCTAASFPSTSPQKKENEVFWGERRRRGLGMRLHLHVRISPHSLGAALVGDTLFVPSVVSRLAYNPLCFLLYEDYLLPPDEWENVSNALHVFFRCFHCTLTIYSHCTLYVFFRCIHCTLTIYSHCTLYVLPLYSPHSHCVYSHCIVTGSCFPSCLFSMEQCLTCGERDVWGERLVGRETCGDFIDLFLRLQH